MVSSPQLQGALKYELMKRDIVISGIYLFYFLLLFSSGFYDMESFLQNITINIWGVVNPNRVRNLRTNYFGFGLIDNTGKTIIEGKMDIDGIIPLAAPG